MENLSGALRIDPLASSKRATRRLGSRTGLLKNRILWVWYFY